MLRAPLHDLRAGERTLPQELAHYLGRVLRLREGDRFVAFDGAQALEAEACILHVNPHEVRVRLGPPVRASVRGSRPILWIHGLAKGDKCDAIVRDATELGVSWIAFASTERAVVKLEGPRARAREERWRRIAEEAARQCGRGDVPHVATSAPLGALIEEACAAARAFSALPASAFCLYERAETPLGPPLREALESAGPLLFLAGPEGGLTENEVALSQSKGFRVASLGARILRTETVVAAVLGAITLF